MNQLTPINDLVALVSGTLAPPLISWLKNSQWSQKQRLLCAIGVCVLIGCLQVGAQLYVTHTLVTAQTAVTDIGLVFSAATASYTFYWRDTTLNTNLERKITL